MKKYVLAVCAVAALAAVGIPSENLRAETYLGAQAGVVLGPKFTDVEGTGASSGLKSGDLTLKDSWMYGLKIGRFFESVPWLGIEADLYHSNPHLEQQNVSRFFGIPGVIGVTATTNSAGAHTSMMTAAANVILRYPGKRIQPYIGGGAGLSHARLTGVTVPIDTSGNVARKNDSDTTLQFNALVGMRFFLTRHVALFGEYKYTRASFNFDDIQIKAEYSAHIFATGLSYHF